MTNEQKIKAYLATGHHAKVTLLTGHTITIVHDNGWQFVSNDASTFYYGNFDKYQVEPLPLTPPAYKEGDKVIILDVAREVAGYSYWNQEKKDMVGKVFTIGDVSYSLEIGEYEFPYWAIAPAFDDEKQTKIQELESQLATIAKELELLKK